MKRKHSVRWLALVTVLLFTIWCLFPIRYSKEYAQKFQRVDAASHQRLIELLLADYAQVGPQDADGRVCYTVVYENSPEGRTAASVRRLWEDAATGEFMKAEVSTQMEILSCLNAIDGFSGLLPEVEVIYVFPELVQIGSHMGIREVFWQRKGLPLHFFRDNHNYRLYWLGDTPRNRTNCLAK